MSVVAGAITYLGIGREEDPNFAIKTMIVSAALPGADVEQTLSPKQLSVPVFPVLNTQHQHVRLGVHIHAFSLMPNHFHFLIKTNHTTIAPPQKAHPIGNTAFSKECGNIVLNALILNTF